jgi:uncharacterized protein YfaS (alpha-2-macroglobulin family)
MAVAQTEKSLFGRAESDFKVSKALLIQPSLPRFARVGDIFKGGVVIHNYTSKKGKINLVCETEGIELLEKSNLRDFNLDSGFSREVLFSFEAREAGTAKFAFRAKMGEETDGLEITIPLKIPRLTETVAVFGDTKKSAEEKVTVPKEIFPSESKIEVLASATALSGLKGCIDYLVDYPYLCLEQRISSALPFIIATDIIVDLKLSELNETEIRRMIKEVIKEIYAHQKNNGGFSIWADSRYESPYMSCYATFALIKASEAGFSVEALVLERAANYLKNLLRGRIKRDHYPYHTRSWKIIQAFALYDLALLNQPESSYAEKLFSERSGLSLFGKTLLLKALHSERGGSLSATDILLQELMNRIKVSPSTAHFEDLGKNEGRWIYSSNTRTTSFILQAMIEIGSDHILLPALARWLVEKRKTTHWHSTHENFFVFYALNEFYQRYEKVKPDFKAEIALAGKILLKETFKKNDRDTRLGETDLTGFKQGEKLALKFKKKGDGILYYGARMTYAPAQKLEPREEGISVLKAIETIDGKPITTVKAGTLVIVTIEIALPQESLFVVVNDPLPAGFEAVNPVFLTESQEQLQSLTQNDRSRRRPWWAGFNHIEMHDDRVLLFADYLKPGVHSHSYLARALNFGTYQTPGTHAEEMYSPEVFGRSEESVFKVIK